MKTKATSAAVPSEAITTSSGNVFIDLGFPPPERPLSWGCALT